jgi:hypothetical protein
MDGQRGKGAGKAEIKEQPEPEPEWAPPEGKFSLLAALRLISFAWVTPIVSKVMQ